jgi:hypothetical protein
MDAVRGFTQAQNSIVPSLPRLLAPVTSDGGMVCRLPGGRWESIVVAHWHRSIAATS